VLEVCRKLGVTEQTFYRWKHKFAGLGVAELRKLRQLRMRTANSSSWSLISPWTSICFKRCCEKSSDADAAAGSRD
jgi:hypothetical protein